MSLRGTRWKYIPDLALADGWYGGKKENANAPKRPDSTTSAKTPARRRIAAPRSRRS